MGDFSLDWTLVQSRVSAFTRICTYDRAGYAWSDAGPKPRTLAQLNVALRDALLQLGERGSFVLVGHSYGGPVAKNDALTNPPDVAGMVLVNAAHEGLRVGIGNKKTIRLGAGAKRTNIPTPREELSAADKPTVRVEDLPQELKTLDPIYKVLPPNEQKMHLWAQLLPGVYDAENSETEWSGEYFAKWLAAPQTGTLGTIPLIVLSRADGGYSDADSDIPAVRMEKERKEGQVKLVLLSSNSRQVIVHCGHNMNLAAPGDAAKAIREVVEAVRRRGKV